MRRSTGHNSMSRNPEREAALAAIWYGEQPPGLGLRIVERIYRGVVALRRWLYRKGVFSSVRLPVPVVVVGNLTAGGSGKTPLIMALVAELKQRGWHPGVVSRGYGGNARNPMMVEVSSDPAQCGDEPCLIRRRCDVPVAIGMDRVAASRLLVGAGVDVILSDDGLQHYQLARNVEICVIDGARRFGNGHLLPAGPLREPLSRLASVDWRVCNGGAAGVDEVAMQLVGETCYQLDNPDRTRKLAEFAEGPGVHAVAGTGNPARFFDSLRSAGIGIQPHSFADHHAYRASDFAFASNLPVLMTEKDAIKCRGLGLVDTWVVPVTAELPKIFVDCLAERLAKATRGAKPCA